MGNCTSNNNFKGEKISKDYFSLINKILNKKNETNYNLKNNLKICLEEKNFDQVSNTSLQYLTYEDKNKPKNFINWLDFIYQYLSQEHSHERYWAMQMIDELDKESFESELKYLSEFFIEEFEIENEPKCIQIEKIKRDIKLNLNNSTLNVTQNLGGSFGSQNIFEDFDNATLKYKEYRNKIKKYILKFKQHILNEDHPINIIAQIFEKIWVDYVKIKIDLIKQNFNDYNDKNNIKIINKKVNELTFQLQRFVVHLQISLKLFYSRTINYSCFNEEKDELINLVTTLVFRTGNIYNTVFELYKLSLIQEIGKMNNCLKKLIKIEPQELGISEKFCLNRQTLNYQEEILLNQLKKSKNNLKNDNKNIEINIKRNLSKESSIDINNNFKDKKEEIKENHINVILKLIRNNKKKCPKYGDREIEETKVNLDYEENFELITNKQNRKREKTLSNCYSSSLFSINDTQNDISILSNNCNLIKQEINNTFEENNIINENYSNDEDYSNKNLIIRKTALLGEEKSLIPTKLEKIFNRVSFIRTKNVDFLSYPYETAIQLLKQIKKYKTPFEKMMIIASISSEITDCINDFWINLSDYIKNDLLNLEGDQLMSIFIYIIIKSQIYDISVHCQIIKNFTTCITNASMIGYYYSTVEASVVYIQSIDNEKELYKKKIE